MKNFIVIIPYFGKLPNYFNLFLKSVKYNDKIDFLLFTDDTDNYEYPNNMSVVNMSFMEFSNKVKECIKKLFDIDIILDKPYKICDYRPFFGEIFFDYIKDYYLWGYCDVDLIFGDIQKELFAIDYLKCDKISCNGHFTLVNSKNNIPLLVKSSEESIEYFNYKEVLKFNDYSFHYDEYNGVGKIFDLSNKSIVCLHPLIADIDFRFEKFYLLTEDFTSNDEEWYFEFNNGKIIGYCSNGTSREFMYIHLQKRKMELSITNKDHFYIITNKFLDNIDKYDFTCAKDLIDYPYQKINSLYFTKQYIINNSSIEYDGNNFSEILDEFIAKLN